MKKVKIANVAIEIENIDKLFFNNRLLKYEDTNFVKPDLVLRTTSVDKIIKPQGEIIEQVCDATIVQLNDHRLCRYLSDSKTREIMSATYYDDTYVEVEIQLLKKIPSSNLTLTEFEYMYTGFAFSDRLTEIGGAVLHGSSIAYDHQGIIFSANSGTGKSTHANLWKERFGSNVTIVNDDKPAIRFYDGIPYLFGTPWSGKTDLNANVQVPLKAVVFIKRAETNWIERLNARDSIFNLMSQISRPYYDEKIGLKTIGIIEKLVQTVPIYRLHCNMSQEAVDTVVQQLNKERVMNL